MSDERGAKSANIFDVARLAGVSHQTVSRVLNDLPNVRPATRARVEQAMAQLRYSPSPAARALVTKRTRTIGLITPGTADFGPTSIAMHFNVAARVERYSVDSVTAPDTDGASIRSVVEGLLRQRVDAIVLVVTDLGVLEVVRGLDLGVPMVAAYRVPLFEELIARLLVKVDTAILANLVLGEKTVPEFLQRDCTAETLTAALLPLFTDTPQRRAQVAAFARLDGIMEIGKAVPSARAAACVLAVARRFNHPACATVTTAPQQE